jgi:hypothetical protein
MLVRNRNSKATQPGLLEVENPWSTGASRVRVFDDEPVSRDELLRQLCHDAMRRPYVVEENDERRLHSDGTRCLRRLRTHIDVILVDAFDDAGVAPSLPRSNFCSRAASRLSDDGMLIMNLAGHDDTRYADNIHAALLAFTGRIILVPVQGEDNLVLFAHKRCMPRAITRERHAVAMRLQTQLQLEFPRFLRLIYQGYVLSRAPPAA